MKSDIGIVTISWIRTPEERSVVLETLQSLSRLHVPLVIVDKGSAAEDLQLISRMPNVILFTGVTNHTEQLKKAHVEGAKIADYLFYLHTDKLDFAQNMVSKMIDRYRLLPKKGLFIPSRMHPTMQAYPKFQRVTEEFLNFFMSEYTKQEEDYYAGPKIYPSSLVKYLDHLTSDIGWGIEAYFYVIAKRLNIPFDFMSFDMAPPIDVDDEAETKVYRLKIVEDQIQGYLKGLEVTL